MNEAIPIIAGVLFALGLIFVFALHGKVFGRELSSHERIADMTFDAVIIAIIMVMTFTPIGYISAIPFLSFTLLHLPVLLGAFLGGPRKGALYGLFFGISSYLQAMTGVGLNALFAFPWVAIPPRLLFGLLAGFVFSFMEKISKKRMAGLYLGLACAALTLTHTVLVFGDLFLFFPDQLGPYFASTTPLAVGTKLTFLTALLLGVAGEMALAFLIIPPLAIVSNKVMPRMRRRALGK